MEYNLNPDWWLFPDEYKVIPAEFDESTGQKKSPTKLRGMFQRADVINGNKRVYQNSLLSKIVSDRLLQESIKKRQMLGELEHPTDGRTKYERCSHVITELKMSEDGKVYGELEVLDEKFPNAKILQGAIDSRIPIGISSRGTGSSKEGTWKGEKAEIVGDDYRLKTFDVTCSASVPGADNLAVAESYSETEEYGQMDLNELKKLANRVEDIGLLIESNQIKDKHERLTELSDIYGRVAQATDEPKNKLFAEDLLDSIKNTKNKLTENKEDKSESIDSKDNDLQNKLDSATELVNELMEQNDKLSEELKGLQEKLEESGASVITEEKYNAMEHLLSRLVNTIKESRMKKYVDLLIEENPELAAVRSLLLESSDMESLEKKAKQLKDALTKDKKKAEQDDEEDPDDDEDDEEDPDDDDDEEDDDEEENKKKKERKKKESKEEEINLTEEYISDDEEMEDLDERNNTDTYDEELDLAERMEKRMRNQN